MLLTESLTTGAGVWQKCVFESFRFHFSAPPRQLVISTHMFAVWPQPLPPPPSPNFDNLKKSVPDYRAHLWVGAREEEGGREAEQNNHFRRLTMPPARKKGLPGCRLARKKGLKDDGEASSLSSAEEEGPIFLSQYSQSQILDPTTSMLKDKRC